MVFLYNVKHHTIDKREVGALTGSNASVHVGSILPLICFTSSLSFVLIIKYLRSLHYFLMTFCLVSIFFYFTVSNHLYFSIYHVFSRRYSLLPYTPPWLPANQDAAGIVGLEMCIPLT